MQFSVRFITLNRRGWSIALAGENGLVVVDLTSPLSASPVLQDTATYNVTCRTSAIGGDRFHSSNNALRILQVAWHPYSDTHIGILSSDGVFRLFDLSLSTENPEQEYHLQAGLSDRSTPAAYARPVAFAFGGEHLWDRFAVFILFSNGFVYAVCPISPFGSLHKSSAIEELYRDACQWASSNADSTAARNASLAASWLEAVFPSLIALSGSSNSLVFKAFAHIPFNSSLFLQGPLPVVMGGDFSSNKSNISSHSSAALTLMYSTVGKDSILAVSLRDGQMQLYALADELQPLWNDGVSPRVQIGSEGNVKTVGMLLETCSDMSASSGLFAKNGIKKDGTILGKPEGVWMGQAPPLLQLAVIDFALPVSVLESAPLSLLADPVVPERLYCHHAAGLDAILLQWLPFSGQSFDRASTGKPPIVYPILDTYLGGKSVHVPLLGVADILDSFGEMWLVAVTASCECAVIEMKSCKALDPLLLTGGKHTDHETENVEAGVLQVISNDLLLGPKDIPIPHVSSSGRPLTLDSIEGRTFLHDQCKLLHEKYIEYAHRVHVELTSHGIRLHKAVQEQQMCLSQAQSKMAEAFGQSKSLMARIGAALQKNKLLKDRVMKHSTILAVKRKPLTAAEQEYKYQLDVMQLQDLEILHSAVDVLKGRFEQYLHFSQEALKQQSRYHCISTHERVRVPDVQMNKLKMALNQLTQVVESALKQVKTMDEMVKERELLSHH